MSSGPRPVPPSVNGWNAEFLDHQYQRYLDDPSTVSDELRLFFQGFDLAQAGELPLASAAGGGSAPVAPVQSPAIDRGPTKVTPYTGRPAGQASHFQAVVDDLISAYRDLGHLCARLDPFERERERPSELGLAYHELAPGDLDRQIDAGPFGESGTLSLKDAIDRLEQIYCGTIGVEFLHIQDTEQRAWLLERFEGSGGRVPMDRPAKAHVLEQLVRSESFEKFLGKRYPGEKRFSLEGAESLIPMLDRVIETASDLGVEEVVVGMAHRGRLNVLANILGKSSEQIFTEFEENWEEDFVDGGGDVKYHRGYSGTRRFPSGKMVHLAMASNPSHLEAVGGVVQGRCRAKQDHRADDDRSRVFPLIIHGDAAVSGQGVAMEIANLSQLEGYSTGGTIHIVVNNMIGFTTVPEDGRSSRYCTDIAKMIDAPVFHVNGEDPEAVVAVAQYAMEYRQKFNRDVYIDLWCYRRHGHNEQDEQAFTQPGLAKLIKSQPSVMKQYVERLYGEGVINQADLRAIEERIADAFDRAQSAAQHSPYDPTIDPGGARWEGLSHGFSFEPVETGVPMETLREVSEGLGRVPEGFAVHRKLKALLKSRSELCETGDISYADAESLAWGTLLLEGFPIRISGQDSRRGTFSHRHAVLFDSESGARYMPLNHLRQLGVPGVDMEPGRFANPDGEPKQAPLQVWDSPLSEFAVMGFDYGYSLSDPNVLVCWEGQFGDFNNGAQVVIDQFLASAESKWDRWSGLVLLLPHGYEGAGPEHSSARMERFLELCGQDNMQVVYPSTAAQCFHMFRRQLKREYRKPLIVMTPKSMLRVATGHISELTTGGFQEFLDDPMFVGGADRGGVKRVVLCCGKIYHELAAKREASGRSDVALVRIEQLYPFHSEMLAGVLAAYPNHTELVYVQEEPRNAGGYRFVADRIQSELGLARPAYIGRKASSTPAVGSKRMHKTEQAEILSAAIDDVDSAADDAGNHRRVLVDKPGESTRIAASA